MGGRVSCSVNVANGYHEDIYVKIVTLCDGSKFTASSVDGSGSTRIGFTRVPAGSHSPFIVAHNSGKNYYITMETEGKRVICDSYAIALGKSVIVDKAGLMKFARTGSIWEDDYGQSHKTSETQELVVNA